MKILIFGASSAIARHVARLYAKGHDFFLVSRNADRLNAVASDLTVLGASKVQSRALDLNDLGAHAGLIEDAFRSQDGFDLVLIAHGELGDAARARDNFAEANRILQTNFLSYVSLLTHLSGRMERFGRGTIAVISSVAGDRGRQSNYVYGAAKGGLNVFLSGLRNRLFANGVRVLTIKPGFVDTPMTKDFPKGGPLWSSPETVAKAIVRAIDRDCDVVYVPGYWRLILLVICAIPERIFKRLKL